MSDVQFTEEQQYTPVHTQASSSKGLIAIIIGLGFASDEHGATKLLLYIFVGAIVLTGVAVFFWMNSGAEAPPPTRNMPLPGASFR
jgi:hypothetical protein